MRGKTARRLRKWTAMNMKKGATLAYQPLKPSRVFGAPIPGINGRPSALFLGQVVMANCLRRAYQETKKAWKYAPHTMRNLPWQIK